MAGVTKLIEVLWQRIQDSPHTTFADLVPTWSSAEYTSVLNAVCDHVTQRNGLRNVVWDSDDGRVLISKVLALSTSCKVSAAELQKHKSVIDCGLVDVQCQSPNSYELSLSPLYLVFLLNQRKELLGDLFHPTFEDFERSIVAKALQFRIMAFRSEGKRAVKLRDLLPGCWWPRDEGDHDIDISDVPPQVPLQALREAIEKQPVSALRFHGESHSRSPEDYLGVVMNKSRASHADIFILFRDVVVLVQAKFAEGRSGKDGYPNEVAKAGVEQDDADLKTKYTGQTAATTSLGRKVYFVLVTNTNKEVTKEEEVQQHLPSRCGLVHSTNFDVCMSPFQSLFRYTSKAELLSMEEVLDMRPTHWQNFCPLTGSQRTSDRVR